MEITVDPELYCPIINDEGFYIDMCPSFILHGIRCPCGTRTDHIFNSKLKFKQHINSVKHNKWLAILNLEKNNYYKENIKLKDTIKEQREIIAKMEIENTRLININKFLDEKIFKNNQQIITTDLLDLNNIN